MNRQLKKMIRECHELERKWYKMTTYNSTDDERKGAWLEILIKRREIAYKCAELLGIKDDVDARVIGSSIDRGHMLHYVKELNYISPDKQASQ
jgi:hypothetical protein